MTIRDLIKTLIAVRDQGRLADAEAIALVNTLEKQMRREVGPTAEQRDRRARHGSLPRGLSLARKPSQHDEDFGTDQEIKLDGL